jgi:malonate transporter
LLVTAESILPIFLLMLGGNLLRRLPIIDHASWRGLEQLGYWLLYPVLVFITILKADFSELELDAMIATLMLSVFVMVTLTYALWPLLNSSGIVTEGEFSSIFQTAVRWNGFVALAISEKIFPPAGMAVIALAMAAIIIPINIASVFVVTRFADRSANWSRILRGLVTNPILLGSLFAVLYRQLPFGLYSPVVEVLDLIAQAALGMGLISIGAGLRIGDLLRPRLAYAIPIVLKLILFPGVMIAVALALGVSGQNLAFLALCAAVPTAMNGYLLARQLGGDAELYAAVATLQTILSFLTIPLVLTTAAQLGGG